MDEDAELTGMKPEEQVKSSVLGHEGDYAFYLTHLYSFI